MRQTTSSPGALLALPTRWLTWAGLALGALSLSAQADGVLTFNPERGNAGAAVQLTAGGDATFDVIVSGEAIGSVAVSPLKDTYTGGDEVTFTYTSAEGYRVRRWEVTPSGGDESWQFTGESYTHTVDGDATIVANIGVLFEYIQFDAVSTIAPDNAYDFEGREVGTSGTLPTAVAQSIIDAKFPQGLAGVMDFNTGVNFGPALSTTQPTELPASAANQTTLALRLALNGGPTIEIGQSPWNYIDNGRFGEGTAGDAEGPSDIITQEPTWAISADTTSNAWLIRDISLATETSAPDSLGGVTSYGFTFDPADKVVIAGLVYLSRGYYQHYNPADVDTLWARATFSDDSTQQMASNQLEESDGGADHAFTFEAPAGTYITRLDVWCSGAPFGNGQRAFSQIDDLFVVLEDPNESYAVAASSSDETLGTVSGGDTLADGSEAALSTSAVVDAGGVFRGWSYAEAPDVVVGTSPALSVRVTGPKSLQASYLAAKGLTQFFNNNSTPAFDDKDPAEYGWSGAWGLTASAFDIISPDHTAELPTVFGVSEGITSSQMVPRPEGSFASGFLYASAQGDTEPEAFVFVTENGLVDPTPEGDGDIPQPNWYSPVRGVNATAVSYGQLAQLSAYTRPRSAGEISPVYRFMLKVGGNWYASAATFTNTQTSDYELQALPVFADTSWVMDVYTPETSIDADLSDNATMTLSSEAMIEGYGLYVDTEDLVGSGSNGGAWVRVDSFAVELDLDTVQITAVEGIENGMIAGTGEYVLNATAELTATPDAGFLFTGWTQGAPGGQEQVNPLMVLADQDKAFRAAFVARSFTLDPETLTVIAKGGSASVSVDVVAQDNWSASSFSDWITIEGSSEFTGDASVTLNIAAHTGLAQRVGGVSIGDVTLVVTQLGVPQSLFPDATDNGGGQYTGGWLQTDFYYTQQNGMDFVFTDAAGWWFLIEIDDNALFAYDYQLDSWFYIAKDAYPLVYAFGPQLWLYLAVSEDGKLYVWDYSQEGWFLAAEFFAQE